MAFNKFDPHGPDEPQWASNRSAHRRALLLKYGWWISIAYTAVGFGFMAYWILG